MLCMPVKCKLTYHDMRYDIPAAEATIAPLLPSNSCVLCIGVLGAGKWACLNKFPAGRGSLRALLVLQINDISNKTLRENSSMSAIFSWFSCLLDSLA